MLTKEQLRIIAIVVLVVSVSLLDSSFAAATTPTTLTITASDTTPAASQPYTLSGTLKSGTTPLSGKTITIIREDYSNKHIKIGTTTSSGTYTFTHSESTTGPYTYTAVFNGDTIYAATQKLVTVTVGNLKKIGD